MKKLVINYGNGVTDWLVAQGISLVGQSPLMIKEPTESFELVKNARSVVINLGTICKTDEEVVQQLCQAANMLGTPLILDPAGIGITNYRTNFAKKLLDRYKFSIIRGNISEIGVLNGESHTGVGIDSCLITSHDQFEHAVQSAREVAKGYDTVVLMTCSHDVIASPTGMMRLKKESSPLFVPQIVGSGDLLSGLCGAYVSSDQSLVDTAWIASTQLNNILSKILNLNLYLRR